MAPQLSVCDFASRYLSFVDEEPPESFVEEKFPLSSIGLDFKL